MCVCVSTCIYTYTFLHTHTNTHTQTHILTYSVSQNKCLRSHYMSPPPHSLNGFASAWACIVLSGILFSSASGPGGI